MIVLAGAVWLPMRVLTGIALLMIAGHNLLGNLNVGGPAWLWDILYRQANIEFAPGHSFFIAYTVIPWFAVLMAGFSLGTSVSMGIRAAKNVFAAGRRRSDGFIHCGARIQSLWRSRALGIAEERDSRCFRIRELREVSTVAGFYFDDSGAGSAGGG